MIIRFSQEDWNKRKTRPAIDMYPGVIVEDGKVTGIDYDDFTERWLEMCQEVIPHIDALNQLTRKYGFAPGFSIGGDYPSFYDFVGPCSIDVVRSKGSYRVDSRITLPDLEIDIKTIGYFHPQESGGYAYESTEE